MTPAVALELAEKLKNAGEQGLKIPPGTKFQ
jgi:hypothetical protein